MKMSTVSGAIGESFSVKRLVQGSRGFAGETLLFDGWYGFSFGPFFLVRR